MNKKIKKRIQGSISVLLIIILVPVMTLSAVVVDTSRINMARSMVSSSGDLAMNTALANYDTILKDVYGLFAMSQKGEALPNTGLTVQTQLENKQLADNIRRYFETTLVGYGVVDESEAGEYVKSLMGDFSELIEGTADMKPKNFMDMEISKFEAVKVENSALNNPDILRNQIVEYMKYRAPLGFGLSFFDSINSFKAVQDQTTVVEKQVIAQESSQDVTSACSKAISTIREYDKLIDEIQTGNKAVTGVSGYSDSTKVDLLYYPKQLNKYKTEWNPKYSHINKLNLVFLAKSPSIDTVYLKNLNIYESQYFVKTDASGILYDGSGINLELPLETTTENAKSQFNTLLSTMNDKNGAEGKTAKTYIDQNYLVDNSKENNFDNESNAMNKFIMFEKFITEDESSTVKYSDVKNTLEQIYRLSKYYDNYVTYINKDIEKANSELQTAITNANNASSNADAYKNTINSNITAINTSAGSFGGDYLLLNGITNVDGENLYDVFNALLGETITGPESNVSIMDKNFINYSGFINSRFKEKGQDADNKYLKIFKEIINSGLKTDSIYQNYCALSSAYLSEVASNTTNKSYESYIKDAIGDSYNENAIFDILNLLYSDYIRVNNISSNIESYNSVMSGYSELAAIKQEKQEVYDGLVNDKDGVTLNYKNCLNGTSGVNYKVFTERYQRDIKNYGFYKDIAKKIIADESQKISEQITKIEDNVKAVLDKLNDISTKLDNVHTAIEKYQENVDKWKGANDSYQAAHSEDSFSKQNAADIDTTKSEYNLRSLEGLQLVVDAMVRDYEDFYNYIVSDSSYKYGTVKIKNITSAENSVTALSGIKDSLPAVVTVEEADNRFNELYTETGYKTDKFEYAKFLNPIQNNQFLKYLNETFPDTENSSGDSGKDEENEATKSEYNAAKESIKTSNNGSKLEDDTESGNKYGYTYKDRAELNKSSLPSGQYAEKKVENEKMKITEKDDKINASDGFKTQSSSVGTLLSGIGNIGKTAYEDVYILDYIFQNFSYNTMIQDMVIDDKGGGKVTFSQAQDYLSQDLSVYKDNAVTLSNYKKNAGNNYLNGAEIEYILYGNANPSTNVTYTKASIYALRFAFNCIYAFTDSDIRNITRSVGLSVQAATAGFVPYQVVQIVLQLALAAAESAWDLNMMNSGLKVAVVKSDATWVMSLKGAGNALKDLAVNTVATQASNLIGEAADKINNAINDGIQSISDATAENIDTSIDELTDSIGEVVTAKMNMVIDEAFAIITGAVEAELNELMYISYGEYSSIADIKAKINSEFDNVKANIRAQIEPLADESEVAAIVIPKVLEQIEEFVDTVRDDVLEKLVPLTDPKDVGSVIVSEISSIKSKLLESTKRYINRIVTNIDKKIKGISSSVIEDINNTVTQDLKNITDEEVEKVKEQLTQKTNDFFKQYISEGTEDAIGNGLNGLNSNSSSDTSVSSAIKFGYKDYLMLFVFIGLVANDDALLCRTADVIQINLIHADTDKGAEYKHPCGAQFRMSNAATYINIKSKVKLDMLFLNMDFFRNYLTSDDTDIESDFSAVATIEYNGLYGY